MTINNLIETSTNSPADSLKNEVSKMRLLIVDDDEELIALAKTTLKKEFEVHSCSQGSKALAQAIATHPEAILLDLNMPSVDGYEVLAQMRSHPLLSSIPIVCMSGDQGEAARRRSVELGAVGFIGKPLNVKTMNHDVHSVLAALNAHLVSSDLQRQFTVVFNETGKYQLIKNDIRSLMNKVERRGNGGGGRKVLVFSWLEGSQFFGEEFSSELEQEQLVFLHLKPSFITRIPFLQDLSVMISDLVPFLKGATQEYVLFFDEPNLLFRGHTADVGFAKVFALSEILQKSFPESRFYSTRSRDHEMQKVIEQMAKVFVGKIKW